MDYQEIPCLDFLTQTPQCDETFETISESKILAMLHYWIGRSSNACENGEMQLTLIRNPGGLSMRFKYHYNEEPCENQYHVYSFTLINRNGQKKLLNRQIVALIVYDNETNSGDMIVLHRFYKSQNEYAQFANWIQQALETINQNPLHHFDKTFFQSNQLSDKASETSESFLYGTLYFYLKTLKNCAMPRDVLVASLLRMKQNSNFKNVEQKWICYLDQSLKKAGILKVFPAIRQPKQKTEFANITRSEQLGIECQGITTLLNNAAACGVDLSDTAYSLCQVYQEKFVEYMVHTLPNTCYGGKMNVAANLKMAWAKVYSTTNLLMQCRGSVTGLIVVLIHLTMGNYNSSLTNQQIKSQARNFYNQGESKEHAMVLIIDTKNKEIELFEPNGAAIEWVPIVFDAIKLYFQDTYSDNFISYQWYEPEMFCPRVSIQAISKRSMCSYFSLLWVYLRIHCPLVERQTLLRVLLQGGKNLIDQLLRGLQCLLIQFVRTNHPGRIYLRSTQNQFSHSSCEDL